MKNKTNTKANKFLNSLLMVVASIFVCSIVFIAIESASTGAMLSKLEQDEIKLEKENSDMSDSLLSSLSLTKIQEKATEMGFSNPNNIIYVKTPETVASLR